MTEFSTDIYPQLSEIALRQKTTRFYIAFIIIRTLFKHIGICSLQNAAGVLQDWMGVTPSDAYRILKHGDNIYWERKKNKRGKFIALKSVARIAFESNIGFLFNGLAIDLREFVGGVRFRRSMVYQTAVCDVSVPVSREKLQERTGISKSLQRTYDRHASIEVIRNYALTGETDNKIMGWQQILEATCKEGLNCRYRISRDFDNWKVWRQLPNSYRSDALEPINQRILDRHNAKLSAFHGEQLGVRYKQNPYYHLDTGRDGFTFYGPQRWNKQNWVVTGSQPPPLGFPQTPDPNPSIPLFASTNPKSQTPNPKRENEKTSVGENEKVVNMADFIESQAEDFPKYTNWEGQEAWETRMAKEGQKEKPPLRHTDWEDQAKWEQKQFGTPLESIYGNLDENEKTRKRENERKETEQKRMSEEAKSWFLRMGKALGYSEEKIKELCSN